MLNVVVYSYTCLGTVVQIFVTLLYLYFLTELAERSKRGQPLRPGAKTLGVLGATKDMKKRHVVCNVLLQNGPLHVETFGPS